MSDYPPPPPPPGSGPPPPPPPPPPSGASSLVPIGPGPRLGAKIIDYLVLLIPIIAISFVVGGSPTAENFSATEGRQIVASIINTLLVFAYFVYLESTRGQTVGKMALNHKVIGPDGAVPTTEAAVRRNAWLLLALVPLSIGGFLQLIAMVAIGFTISSDSFKRGWHDNFAGGTAVVRTN